MWEISHLAKDDLALKKVCRMQSVIYSETYRKRDMAITETCL
jgi:hypothetical protein